MTEHQQAKPINVSSAAIQSFAERVANLLNFKPGDDLEPLVTKLGGHIEYVPFSQLRAKEGASIVIRSHNDFTIFLSEYTSLARDRFSIAHELGHYFLHYPASTSGGPMVAERFGTSKTETEANWFAAGFLMPKDAFSALFNELNGDIGRVANRFNVSPSAARVRADALGLKKLTNGKQPRIKTNS